MKLKSYKHFTILFLICIISIFSFHSVYAQPGTIDMTYGENGIFIGRNYGNCYGASMQLDGKIIMVGQSFTETYDAFTIVRLSTDGHPDESFGEHGRVINDFGFEVQVAFAAIVQPDGRIVAVGVNYEDDNTRNNFLVARYLTDGRLDSSFAENGWLTTDFNGDDYARSVAIQPDGKIVVAGSNTYRALVARYNTDGSLDESFGNSGLVITRVNSFPIINAMALQADGKIVLAGTLSSNSNGSVVMCRYTPDGKPDEAFGKSGVLISDWVQGYGEICNDMVIQNDGKILLAGSVVISGASYAKQSIVRYNQDGSFDNSFGENGVALYDIENFILNANSIVIQPDGKIISSGQISQYPSFTAFYLIRFQSNGTVDLGFGNEGLAKTEILDGAISYEVLIHENKIFAAGFSATYSSSETNFCVIGYNGGESSLPITYKNFTATQKNGFIQLNWQTSNEMNNSYFAVERSSTGSTFIEIARVNSNSSGNTAIYVYADKVAQDGNNYYRLKQVDKDGKSSYSKTISIQFTRNVNIKIQPNPVKDKLTVNGLAAGENKTLLITDMAGNILKKINTATSQQEINVQQLLPGSYILIVKSKAGLSQVKFVKQ